MQDLLIETLQLVNNRPYSVKGGKSKFLEIPSRYEGYYSIKNSVCAVLYRGIVYIFPAYDKAMRAIRIHFIEGFFDVPFSNGDVSTSELRWNRLLEIQKQENALEFAEKCSAYATQHLYRKTLPKELLAKCLKLPVGGFQTQDFLGKPSWQATPISSYKFDTLAASNLCTFGCTNGVTIFIYIDGSIYLTPSQVVRETLKERGYKQTFMEVPLSNGDLPEDALLARQWNRLLAQSA